MTSTDDELDAQLDASDDVRARQQEVADSYARAYANGVGLGDEFAGWEDQGQRPES